MNEESERVTEISSWYIKDQLNFDKQLIKFRYESLKPRIRGTVGLELGSGDGEMTKFLAPHFESLTVVDGSQKLLDVIPNYKGLTKINSLFEEFEPSTLFDTIIMEHILEHVDDPVGLLKKVKQWLAKDGRILLGVPNGNSIHRLAAVKMGLLSEPCQLNDRDIMLGHRRVYVSETLRKDIEDSGLEIEEMGGVFLKPISNGQIDKDWDEAMINGFYELGKDFPDLSAELYVVCRQA